MTSTNSPTTNPFRRVITVSSAAALLALGGCDRALDVGEAEQTTGEAIIAPERLATPVPDAANPPAPAGGTAAMGAAGATRQPTARTGVVADDTQITTRVNAGLAADKDLSAMQIDVDTEDAVVTLRGTAPSATAKARAAEVVRRVPDVRSVNNELVVRGG